jgi:hypothetical protein
MTRVYVFIGPSIPVEAARAELPEAEYLPPVAQGDVYRVARHGARAIGIIDGFFERQPAVWHKEILWALSHGIPVYGSASMGALRAAELSVFGMQGVGAIFEAFDSGQLEDDDEVAVAHTSAEDGYRALSEPLVNIRPTLQAAESANVLGSQTRAALEEIARALFYPERSYPNIVRRGLAEGLPRGELDGLLGWLPRHRIDQKRADALSMLRLMRQHLEAGQAPPAVEFRFVHTTFWEAAVQTASATSSVELDGLLAELALNGPTALRVRHDALVRQLAIENAELRGYTVEAATLERLTQRFRAARGLQDDDALERWLSDNHLTLAQFRSLMRQEALAARVLPASEDAARARVADQLRLSGEYPVLVQRASAKQAWLAAQGLERLTPEDVGLSPEALVRWHFARLGSPRPTDLGRYGRSVGLQDERELIGSLVREFCWVSAAQDESAA